MSQEWAEKELAGIDLGDARLNKRSVTHPTASIPHACNGWAETQAAYRFLAQQGIGWDDILVPHFYCTQQRMQGRPGVLCIQDTTELDFNGQQTEGLGTLSFAAQRGMYLHPTYAVSPEREPLGVLDAWMSVRDASKTASRSLPAGAKESCRWLQGYERLAEQASLLPKTRLVYVADRESDFHDWRDRASALGTPVDWLIRSAHNRKLVGQQEKLWDGFAEVHILGEVRFYLPARKGQKARQVVQRVGALNHILEPIPVGIKASPWLS
ncbi:IS4 family transposase [Noviherbaspirillum soli]|uniref:IS4 family transposase n=1 Tax=Noviherbaspirillum soli TaxID=1064518 RepID=UPI00188BA056|nr:IS4 family transposase [Noviherbaspirillum soli]